MRNAIVSILLLWLPLASHATEEEKQTSSAHSLCLNFGGGLHTHIYQAEGGKNTHRAGGVLEVRYQYVPKEWGFAIGVQLASYRSKTTINHGYDETGSHDDNNMPYTLTTQFRDWKERQNSMALEVPLSVLYRHSFSEKWGVQLGVGATLFAPFKGRYQTLGGSYSTSGYFEHTNVKYEDLDNHGFQTEEKGASQNIENLKYGIGAHIEFGFVRSMGKASAFYMGLYACHNFTNVLQAKSNYLFDNGEYQGVFESNIVKEVHPFKAGVKLGFHFGCGAKKNDTTKEKVEYSSDETSVHS